MQNQKRIRSGINFFAPFYDFGTFLFFGNSILHSQTFLLPELKKCKNVLVFGGGTGKLLIELLKIDIAEHYCYVDISDKMIAKSRERLEKILPEKIKSVQFICGSYNDIPEKENFELIITPNVLNFFNAEELPIVLQQLHLHLAPNGEWLFTDFNIPENRWGKIISIVRVRVMYFAFKIICGLRIKRLPDFKKEFAKLNYCVRSEKYFLNELLVARLYKEMNTEYRNKN